MKNSLLAQYQLHFQDPKVFIKSPGRANIIGEHTDYNHGLVLPFAIDQAIGLVVGKNNLGKLRIHALDKSETFEISLNNLKFEKFGWSRYFINAIVALSLATDKIGFDVVFGGDLPQGGGVSSSSAITCGFLAGLNAILNLNLSNDHLIQLASQAENGIGLNGGTMDQTAIFKGKMGKAILIDFLNNSTVEIDLPINKYSFYLFNSGQKHDLVETEYNNRRASCEEALSIIKSFRSEVKTFRDLTPNDVNKFLEDETTKKRCKHVLEENQRVADFILSLESQNGERMGSLLYESHKSLSQNYEVSTPEIDFLVSKSLEINSILGSRIMGGGFGGCTINLTKETLEEDLIQNLTKEYKTKTGYDLEAYQVVPSEGISIQLL